MLRPTARLLALGVLALGATTSTALAEDATICVYDPLGTNGAAYGLAEKMALKAAEDKGVSLELKAHVEEKTAAEDLVAGKCDGAVLTGVKARTFGLATSTVEAIGALPEYGWLKTTLAYLADERMASFSQAGDYENAGIFPAGRVLLFSQNKAWTSSSDLAGKKIATIDNDAAARTMVEEVGASTVAASTATFGPMFNSGSVDACYAPATAIDALELYRGLADGGGIIDFPLSQLTFQLVIKKDQFPEGFGAWGRSYAVSQFDRVLASVKAEESSADKFLYDIPAADKPGYEERFRKVRLKLREKGVYDAKILGLMRRVRCKADGSRAECVEKVE